MSLNYFSDTFLNFNVTDIDKRFEANWKLFLEYFLIDVKAIYTISDLEESKNLKILFYNADIHKIKVFKINNNILNINNMIFITSPIINKEYKGFIYYPMNRSWTKKDYEFVLSNYNRILFRSVYDYILGYKNSTKIITIRDGKIYVGGIFDTNKEMIIGDLNNRTINFKSLYTILYTTINRIKMLESFLTFYNVYLYPKFKLFLNRIGFDIYEVYTYKKLCEMNYV